MAGLRQGPKIFGLQRNATQRWHLLRTMVTQLVLHERIRTTYSKAKALSPLAYKVLRIAKNANKLSQNDLENELVRILTIRKAAQKLVSQILPRLQGTNQSFIRIKQIEKNRLGDNTKMASIEFTGNELEKYEQASLKDNQKFDKALFSKQLLSEEQAFYQTKIDQQLEKIKLQSLLKDTPETPQSLETFQQTQKNDQYLLKFYQQKLVIVNHELWISNKHKLDTRKYLMIQ